MQNNLTITALLALVLSQLFAGCATAPQGPGKRSDSREDLATIVTAAWNSHDPDKIVAAYTDDIVYEDVPHGIICHGPAELRETIAGFFAADGDVKFKVVNSWVHNGHGVLEWVWRGIDKGEFKTGKPFSIRGLTIFEVRDGKISRNRDYYDVATKMRDVGALPK
jgi:steroid delta-isomerase-like uncharacterized protein